MIKLLALLFICMGCASETGLDWHTGYKPYDSASEYVRGVADGVHGGCVTLMYVAPWNYEGLFTEKEWEHNVDYAEETKLCEKMWKNTLEWMNPEKK